MKGALDDLLTVLYFRERRSCVVANEAIKEIRLECFLKEYFVITHAIATVVYLTVAIGFRIRIM